jgi:ubiquinone/menaquinone biosynthesis C-methylase UbiE
MKEYLTHTVDTDDPDLVSAIDELPLWSAPFGLRLLEVIELKQNSKVLDLGCGPGFPLIEIASRLGSTAGVYGLDPWQQALQRVKLKLRVNAIKNTLAINGHAEQMPFPDECFDLIVSNNGINNVRDMKQSIRECFRVGKSGAQLVFTLNLEKTMIEFYSVFQKILKQNKIFDALPRVKQHIYDKRRPLSEIKSILRETGFQIRNVIEDSFKFRFTDGTSMLNHFFIKNWFLDSWKKIPDPKDLVHIFDQVETELNRQAQKNDEIDLSIPFVTIDCKRR